MTTLTWRAAMAWRLRRHALEPSAAGSVRDAAERVLAVRGWPAEPAGLSVALRRSQPRDGELERALAAGEVIRSYAFRGGSYVMTHDVAATLLSVRTTSRVWASRRYQRQGGFEVDDWEPVREAVCEAVAAGPATRAEIGAHLERSPSLRHLAEAAATGAGSDSLLKPLHWWGDIAFGPTRDGRATFRLLRDDPAWPGTRDVDVAGPRAVEDYLAAYGPATLERLAYWLVEGLSVPRSRLREWIAASGDTVRAATVDGVPALALARDLDAMAAAEPTGVVHLLPAFDPWINGPGTADDRVVAPGRRALASRGASLVVRDGVVVGTWRTRGATATVSWFAEAGSVPHEALEQAVDRLATAADRDLVLAAIDGA